MSRVFLRKILIRDEKSALEALEEIKIQGGDVELVKKEIERVTGIKVYDIDSALSVLSDRVAERVKKVDDKIGEISKGLTDDPKKQELVKGEIEKMVKGELRTESEDIDSLAKAVEGEEMEIKKAVKTARGMVLQNPKEVRLYREEKADDNLSEKEKELLKKGLGDKNYSEKEDELLKKGLLNRKKKLAEEVVSAAGLENQEQAVMEKFRDTSPGKTEMAFRHVEIATGFKRMSSGRREAVLEENNKINSELGRFKSNIPSNEISRKVLALDGVAAYLGRNKRSLGYSGSSQGGGSFLVRFKMTFYNLGMVLMGRRTTEDGNGFLMTMRGQPASDFVQNSMGLLLNHDLNSSLGRMFAGMAKSGIKNLAGDAALKLAGGPAGLAASKVLGFLKKFFGGAGSKLGIGMRNGLGSAFDKGWSGLGKAAAGLGALLASIGGLGIGAAVASTTISGAVIGGIAAPVVYQQYIVPGEMISALPNAKRECKSRMDWMLNVKKPAIPCGDMTEYNNILKQKIEEVGYQTRCAVVEAAQYLALDFPYYISYKWGGYYYGDGVSENWCGSGNGMDCNSFIVWAFRQGGFAMKKYGRSELWQGFTSDSDYKTQVFETEKIAFSEANCARIKEIAKPGDIIKTPGVHAALVIGFDGTKLAIAQEGGNGLGLNVCYLNPCTGSGRGFEHRCGKFEEYWSMDKFFEYYVEGTSINGFSIKPNSEVRNLPKE